MAGQEDQNSHQQDVSPKGVAIESAVHEIVDRIVEEVHPLRIILFGSAARGEQGRDSDVDLLVVMPEGVHRRRTAQELYRRLRGLAVPIDILVTTQVNLDRHKDNPDLIYRTILQEGKVLYAA